jgi:hypothetical protein
MKRLFIGIGMVFLLLLGASPAMSSPGPTKPTTDTLRVLEDDDKHLSARFGRSSTAMTLTARQTALGRASATVDVNGKSISVQRDLLRGKASWTGAGAVLTPAEHDGLLALSAQVHRAWVAPARATKQDLPDHTDLMIRLVMLAAEAPPGVALRPNAADRPVMKRETAERIAMAGRAKASCTDRALATTPDNSAEREQALSACQASNEDGILFMSCTRANRAIFHDAASHCLLYESVNSGPGSPGCLGECGPDCNGIDTYTYDCGDHDRCGRVHGGSLNPWDSECGDEYWEADDDFLWAPVNRC